MLDLYMYNDDALCLNNLCEGSTCIAPYLFKLSKLIGKF